MATGINDPSIQFHISNKWIENDARVLGKLKHYPPPKIKFPRTTNIPNCFLPACLPHIANPSYRLSTTSLIHFWQDLSDSSIDFANFLVDTIRQQFQANFHSLNVFPKVNPPASWLLDYLKKAKARSQFQRLLIYYYAHGTPPPTSTSVPFFSPEGRAIEYFNLPQILELAQPCSAFVFDCDCAGVLYDNFKSFEGDTFAFFSCGPNELLSRANGLPADLFTSCLVSPAKMALLWHSRHYFCFTNGPLKPLDAFFTEDEENQELLEKIFKNISTLLKNIVEAIAFMSMDRDLFMQFFRGDHILSQLAINFIFACRVFSSINQHPMSYPEMPPMHNHQLWASFDMRLDAELFTLREKSGIKTITFSDYLMQAMVGFKNAVNVSSQTFVPQLAFVPVMLVHPELAARVLPTLANFLDKSPQAINSALHFPIFQPLFRLLFQKARNKYLLFCFIKMIAYEPNLRDIRSDKLNEFFDGIIQPLLVVQCQALPLMIVLLMIHQNPTFIELFLTSKLFPRIVSFLQSNNPDVVVFTLLIISCVADLLDPRTKFILFEKIKQIEHRQSEEVRIAIMYAAKYLFDESFKDKLIEYILMLATTSELYLARQEFIVCLTYIFSRMKTKSNYEETVMELLSAFEEEDNKEIAEYSRILMEQIKERNVEEIESNFLNSYKELILGSIVHILDDPSMLLTSRC